MTILNYLSRNYSLGEWKGHHHFLQLQERCEGGDGYYALVFKDCNPVDMTTIDSEEISTEMKADDVQVVRKLAAIIRFEHREIVECTVDELQPLLVKVRECCKEFGWEVERYD